MTPENPSNPDERNPLMVVTGVSGSGKDYLIEAFRDQSKLSVEVVNFGQELFERAQALRPSLSDRDRISQEIPQSELYRIIEELACDIRSRGPAVLNTHVLYRQGESLVINPKIEQQISANVYAFIEADPEQIADWRACDTTRDRDPEDSTTIGLHQDIARAATAYLAEYVGARFVRINNTPETFSRNWRLLEENVAVRL
ncbi:MAG: AAA family ATPase [Patescibacteria group bacterium]